MKTTSCFITPLITSIILLCGAWTSTVAAATPYIFVNGECGNDAWTGRYSQCFGPDGYKRTIQAALNAIPDGGNIVVRAGTYSGDGNRDLDFHGKAVRLYGYDCIIDCGGIRSEQHRAFHFYSGETESSIVQGFTITNGMAWKGGAVLCANSSPKFLNCTFQGNEATEDDTGGGAVFNDDSSPTFESCTFADNIAMPSASYGGAITNEASSPTLTDCTFSNNHAWSGGGMYNRDNSNPALENCTFLDNQAVRGAGMGNSGSSPILSRCTFTGNSAS
jgi:parallel beta-helix repeat protein